MFVIVRVRNFAFGRLPFELNPSFILEKTMPPITIAIPDNPFFLPLVQNRALIAQQYNFTIITASEERCAELLLTNRAEIALMSPLGYGAAVAQVDYRIIPATAISSEGFTDIASVYFSPSLQTIDSIASPNGGDFIIQAGKIVLAEKFDIHPKFIAARGSIDELLALADSALLWHSPDLPPASLDISEEWLDAFETPMPIAFWVCRPDDLPENITDIIRSFATHDLPDYRLVHDHECESPESHHDEFSDYRTGKIHYKWTDETEDWLDHTLDALFYHQLIPALPAVKIFGRDSIHE